MCFSAGASFTASALLTVVGTETVRRVHKPSQLVFSGITAFFAFQQFTEGVLWTVIPAAGHPALQKTATYTFLIMAEVVWPVLTAFASHCCSFQQWSGGGTSAFGSAGSNGFDPETAEPDRATGEKGNRTRQRRRGSAESPCGARREVAGAD